MTKKVLWFIVNDNNHIKILKEKEIKNERVYTQGFETLEKAVNWRNDNINEQLLEERPLEKLVIKGVPQPCAVAEESNYKKGFDDAIKAALYNVKDFGYTEDSYLYDSIKKLQD